MEANIANFVRQDVRVPKSKPLLPIFEAVSNSLDSIRDRSGKGTIRIKILREPDELDGTRGVPHSFIIEDDGIGFTQKNIDAFDQLYSDHKARHGGKGRGRFAFLKVFQTAQVDSVFEDVGQFKARQFTFDLAYSGQKGASAEPTTMPVKTRVTLSGMREEFAANTPRDPDIIAREFILHFFPVLLTNRHVEIIVDDGTEIKLAEFFRTTLLIESQCEEFEIGSRTFSLTSAKLRPKSRLRHRLILAASSREVRGDPLEKLIPVLGSGPLNTEQEPEEFLFVTVVEGKFLDDAVDPMRVAFTNEGEDTEEVSIGDDEEIAVPRPDLLGEPQSIRHIRNEAVRIVRQQLEPYIADAVRLREKAISNYMRRDGMGYHFLRSELPELAKGLRSIDDQAIETFLHAAAYKERRKRSTEANQLLSATPKEKSEQAYFEKWEKIVDSLGDVAKSDLANYVAHRRVILDLVSDVIKATPEGHYRREEVIHSIVFPKGQQSGLVGYEQQNLWLVDERLTFHEHLYSDISINRITAGALESGQRPDLAIFASGFASYHDGSKPPSQLVVIELKKPARDDASRDDPVGKTLEYVEKLKAGKAKTEGGAIIDIQENALTTVYLLADWTDDFRRYLRREDFTEMPGDVGQYRYRPIEKIMFIAMSFERLIENARRRNRIFFRKLGIEQ